MFSPKHALRVHSGECQRARGPERPQQEKATRLPTAWTGGGLVRVTWNDDDITCHLRIAFELQTNTPECVEQHKNTTWLWLLGLRKEKKESPRIADQGAFPSNQRALAHAPAVGDVITDATSSAAER